MTCTLFKVLFQQQLQFERRRDFFSHFRGGIRKSPDAFALNSLII